MISEKTADYKPKHLKADKKPSQTALIAEHLEKYGSISSIEAIQLFGCTRLSARIKDLRTEGWTIKTETASSKNRYGHNSNFGVYRLEARP